MNKAQHITNGIANKGFSGLQGFVNRIIFCNGQIGD